jgi:hypothetical protein
VRGPDATKRQPIVPGKKARSVQLDRSDQRDHRARQKPEQGSAEKEQDRPTRRGVDARPFQRDQLSVAVGRIA